MEEKKSLSVKTYTDVEQAVLYLEAITAGLKAGKICVQKGDEHIVVNPANSLTIEIEARHKKGRESVEIGLFWNAAPAIHQASSELRVSSVAPEPELADVDEAGEGTQE